MYSLSNLPPVPLLLFGGGFKKIKAAIKRKKMLVLTNQSVEKSEHFRKILQELSSETQVTEIICVASHPSLEFINSLLETKGVYYFEALMAIGGGSVIDVAKAIINFKAQRNNLFNAPYIEAQRSEASSQADASNKELVFVVIPTTSGSGSESTPFATIWDQRARKKLSIESEQLVPDLVQIEVKLLRTMPKDIRLIAAMDALSHSLESLWNKNATPYSKSKSMLAAEILLDNIPKIVSREGSSDAVYENIAYASSIAGQAIALTRTSLAHGISYPLTINFGIPHGIASSFALYQICEKVINHQPNLVNIPNLYSIDYNYILSRLRLIRDVNEINRLYADHLGCVQTWPQYVDEMFTPGRTDNFIINMDGDDVKNLVGSALGYFQ